MSNTFSNYLWIYTTISLATLVVFFLKVSPSELSGMLELLPYIFVGNFVFSLSTSITYKFREIQSVDKIVSRRFFKSVRQGLLLGILVATSLYLSHSGLLNGITTLLLVAVVGFIEWLFTGKRHQAIVVE